MLFNPLIPLSLPNEVALFYQNNHLFRCQQLTRSEQKCQLRCFSSADVIIYGVDHQIWYKTLEQAGTNHSIVNMVKNLTKEQRHLILYLHGKGESQRNIAKEVGCGKTGVLTTIRRWEQEQSLESRKGQGRKKKSTPREVRTLVRLSLENRRLTSVELAAEWNKTKVGPTVTPSTVRRRLLENGLRGCKARRKPKVTEKQRLTRLKWAKDHQHWTSDQWAMVIFSDESTFTCQNHAGNNFVRRRPGEEFKPDCILPTIKHPTSVMVWGCMSAAGVGRLHVCEGMMNGAKYIDVLEKKLIPSARDLFGDNHFIFQDDNAPCHRAIKVRRWYEQHNITRISWPAQSPDLNPIENLWQRMGVLISKDKPTTKRGLIEKIIAAWNHVVTTDELKRLVDSMPRRCAAVIANRGYPTKY